MAIAQHIKDHAVLGIQGGPGNIVLRGSLNIQSPNGIDIGAGADGNIDLITVKNVAGTSKLWWDESEDTFALTNDLTINSGYLYINNNSQSLYQPNIIPSLLQLRSDAGTDYKVMPSGFVIKNDTSTISASFMMLGNQYSVDFIGAKSIIEDDDVTINGNQVTFTTDVSVLDITKSVYDSIIITGTSDGKDGFYQTISYDSVTNTYTVRSLAGANPNFTNETAKGDILVGYGYLGMNINDKSLILMSHQNTADALADFIHYGETTGGALKLSTMSSTCAGATLELDNMGTGTSIQIGNNSTDVDIDLLTVNVTGSPTLYWDESSDAMAFDCNVLLDEAKSLFFRDANSYIYSNGSGYLALVSTSAILMTSNNIQFGKNINEDVVLDFLGDTSDGQLKWVESGDYFEFMDNVMINNEQHLYFRDSDIHLYSASDGVLYVLADSQISLVTPSIVLGSGSGDVALTFDGTTDGSFSWITGSNYFKFENDVLTDSTNSLYFRDTAISINSATDGHLDLTADTIIDLNADTLLETDKYLYFNSTTSQRVYRDTTKFGLQSYETGSTGYALDLNGVNAIRTATNMADLQNDFTYTCWVQLNSLVGTQVIFGTSSGGNYAYLVYRTDVGSYDNFLFQGNFSGNYSSSPTFSLVVDTWYFLAFRRSGNTWDVRVNNIAVSTKTVTYTPSNSNVTAIGERPVDADLRVNGIVDDARIYDRALSNTELDTIYASATDTSAPNMIHRYTFDEGTGSTANDSVGVLDGTITASDLWVTGYSGFGAYQWTDVVYRNITNNNTYLKSNITTNSGNPAFEFNTDQALTTAGDVLLNIANAGNSKFSLAYDGALSLGGNLVIGNGAAGVDYTLTFNGETTGGVMAWMEDEDYFQFNDDLAIANGEKLYFVDTDSYIWRNTTSGDLQIYDTSNDIELRSQAGNIFLYCTAGVTIGRNADVDYYLMFNGATSDGYLYWMEDEDYFQFKDNVTFDKPIGLNVAPAATAWIYLVDNSFNAGTTQYMWYTQVSHRNAGGTKYGWFLRNAMNVAGVTAQPAVYGARCECRTVNACPITFSAVFTGINNADSAAATGTTTTAVVFNAEAITLTNGATRAFTNVYAYYAAKNNVGTAKDYIFGCTDTINFESGETDSGTAVAFQFDTANALSTAGSLLFDLRNQTTTKFKIDYAGNLDTQGNITLGDGTNDSRITFDGGNDGYIEWQEDELQFHIEGGVEISTWLNMGGAFFPRQVNDADMDATDGTEGEIVYNLADNIFYGCQVTGTPATWAAFNA